MINQGRWRNINTLIQQQNAFDPEPRAVMNIADQIEAVRHEQQNRLSNRQYNLLSGQNTGANFGSTGNGSLDKFIAAISGKESGGNYGARNPSSGALGKYQIMPGNFQAKGGWDYNALGYDITPQQFRSSPALQEKVARYQLTNYYNKYGAAGAAAAWYGGPGRANNWQTSTKSQGKYPSIYNYVQDILRRMR
jgi:hypothetical protein